MFGSPETTTGGNALKFYASVRMDVRRIGSIKDTDTEDGDIKGNRSRVKIVKNKVAPPFREAEFDIIFNEGISQIGEIVDLGAEKGIIDKMGAWYSFKGERIGQGRESAKTYLREHPELAKEIRGLILSTVGIENAVSGNKPTGLDKIATLEPASNLDRTPKAAAPKKKSEAA